jgi:hypothetical protein
MHILAEASLRAPITQTHSLHFEASCGGRYDFDPTMHLLDS